MNERGQFQNLKFDTVSEISKHFLQELDTTDPVYQRERIRVIMELQKRNRESCAYKLWRVVKCFTRQLLKQVECDDKIDDSKVPVCQKGAFCSKRKFK